MQHFILLLHSRLFRVDEYQTNINYAIYSLLLSVSDKMLLSQRLESISSQLTY